MHTPGVILISLSLSLKVASSILERVREVLHMEPDARENIASKEKKGDELLVEVEVLDKSVNELYAVLEACGIEALFDSVHLELGVDKVKHTLPLYNVSSLSHTHTHPVV